MLCSKLMAGWRLLKQGMALQLVLTIVAVHHKPNRAGKQLHRHEDVEYAAQEHQVLRIELLRPLLACKRK
jgi:hypothetical protein